MWRRRVLARGDDREVHDLVTLGNNPCTEIGGHLGLRAPDERDRACLQFGGDPVHGSPCSPQRSDLCRILRHPHRADDVDSAPEGGVRHERNQLDEESCPHLIPHGRHPRAPGETRNDLDRILGLGPGVEREHPSLFGNTRCLKTRDDEDCVPIAGNHEHRQALERHGVIAGEVRQVEAEREQHHVDALCGHRLSRPVEPGAIDGGGER